MPEAPPPPPPEAPPAEPEGTETEELDLDRAKAKIHKANEEAKALRRQLKALEPLAAQAKEQEEAKKTAEQRAAERDAAAERRVMEAETRALRLEVAIEKGLPSTLAARLIGTTKEELEEDAAVLLATLTPTPPAPEAPPNGRPKERMRPGAVPATEALNGDPLLASLKTKLGIT